MSNVTVLVPQSLRQFTDGSERLRVEAETVGQAVAAFAGVSIAIRTRLLDESNSLRGFVRVFLDDELLRLPQDNSVPLGEGKVLTLLIAVAGG